MLFEAKDFRPAVGHKFQFRMEPDPSWSILVDCEVLTVDEPHRLAYTWVVEAQGHSSVVTWTLTDAAEMLLFSALHVASRIADRGPLAYWLVVAAISAIVAAPGTQGDPRESKRDRIRRAVALTTCETAALRFFLRFFMDRRPATTSGGEAKFAP